MSSQLYRYGEGAVSGVGEPDPFAKWNFDGTGFTLWAPAGPQFGQAEILLDGVPLTTLNFHADGEVVSRPVLTHRAETGGFHALLLKPLKANIIPLDCLQVLQDPS